MKAVALTTERLLLRALSGSDLQGASRVQERAGTRTSLAGPRSPYTRQDTTEWIDRMA
jgi:hypothetical protein